MKRKLVLVFIISFAFALRIWILDMIPFGFTPDEASFGYDAYSLLKTGKDQWGHTTPLVLESFGDFKMPAYSYLSVPSVAVFGLNKFAVRLPNALLGTAAVLITYLLVKKLLELSKESAKYSWTGSVIAGLLLTISPWHIMMSRGAFEANLTTFFLPLAIYFFIRGIDEKKYLNLASLFFGLNLFTYHSARLVTPLIFVFLIFLFRDKLLKSRDKNTVAKNNFNPVVPLGIFALFLTAAVISLYQGGGRRAKDITIFSGALNDAADERFVAMYQGVSANTARLFHNKYQVIAKRFSTNYLSYFSPNFLFVSGPAEGTYGMIPGRGVIYWFELPFLVGFLYSFFVLNNKKAFALILFWILVAPIPAALTTGRGFAANRAVIMLPGLAMASAMGAASIINVLKRHLNNKLMKVTIILYSSFSVIFLLSFLEDYFILSPYKTSQAMLYGNLEVTSWISKNIQDKKKIVISRSLSEPHIYVAFANKWNPGEYQKETQNWAKYKDEGLSFLDQLGSYSLDKYEFSSIDYKKYQTQKDVLLVGKPDEFPPNVKPLVKLVNPNGTVSIIVIEPFNQAYAQAIN